MSAGFRRRLRRWGIYNVVAFAGFVLQVGAISALTRLWGWSHMAATLAGVELALLHNFAGHTGWTWADRRPRGLRSLLRRLGRYQAALSVMGLLNVGATVLLARTGLPIEIANVLAVISLSIVSFLLADLVLFRPDEA
jgi:putative flippase GtrA